MKETTLPGNVVSGGSGGSIIWQVAHIRCTWVLTVQFLINHQYYGIALTCLPTRIRIRARCANQNISKKHTYL